MLPVGHSIYLLYSLQGHMGGPLMGLRKEGTVYVFNNVCAVGGGRFN